MTCITAVCFPCVGAMFVLNGGCIVSCVNKTSLTATLIVY